MTNYTNNRKSHRREINFHFPIPGRMIKVNDDVYEVQVTGKNRFSARNYDGEYITLTDLDRWEVM